MNWKDLMHGDDFVLCATIDRLLVQISADSPEFGMVLKSEEDMVAVLEELGGQPLLRLVSQLDDPLIETRALRALIEDVVKGKLLGSLPDDVLLRQTDTLMDEVTSHRLQAAMLMAVWRQIGVSYDDPARRDGLQVLKPLDFNIALMLPKTMYVLLRST